MTRRSLALVASSGVLIAAAATLPSAQTAKSAPARPQLYQAVFVTVQPGTMTAYTDYQQKDVMPALKKAGVPARIAWSSGAFGDNYAFAFFSPVANLSQYDGPNPMVKALGEQAAEEVAAKGAKMITSRRVVLVRTHPELGIQGDPAAPPAPLAIITHVTVADGRRAEFETLIKREVVPVMQQAKVKEYDVLEVIYGEESGTYYTALPYESYEAIGKGHPFQIVLGDEGTKKLEAKFAGITTHVERFVARHRPDLSFRQSAPSTR
jgi:hypothetical protein